MFKRKGILRQVLEELIKLNNNIEEMKRVSNNLNDCIKTNSRSYGARKNIITGHWND